MIVAEKLHVLVVTVLSIFLFARKEVHSALSGSKLFVFGNSYVDTGNTPDTTAGWKQPYGKTFPGKPAGRWSDGKVWSDFIATHLGLPSPVPYERRAGKDIKKGVNFAYAGTGVFDTAAPFPNMTLQIDNFQAMIKKGIYNAADLKSTVAVISVSGDDLNRFRSTHIGPITVQEWQDFEKKVVDQMIVNIKRIDALGVKTIVVDSMEPLGCIPYLSASSSYKTCDSDGNRLAANHNQLLKNQLTSLARTNTKSLYYYPDFYTSWDKILKIQKYIPWSPCCAGNTAKTSCGNINAKGEPQYSVCSKANSSFFWDDEHPTQQGWSEVYSNLKNSFNPLR